MHLLCVCLSCGQTRTVRQLKDRITGETKYKTGQGNVCNLIVSAVGGELTHEDRLPDGYHDGWIA